MPAADWIEPRPVTVPPELSAAVGGHPLIAELLARRGLADPARALAFLDPNAYVPAPAEDMPGMRAACERIEAGLERAERIWVWGDFDVDGQTSTALLVETLRLLGGRPRYYIPVRATESHGVHIPSLERIRREGADLLLTCDTGITAHDALQWARTAGLEVIVTDHHALGDTLPPALAHLTPRLLPPGHPQETLPGVGTAYLLAEALLHRAGKGEEAARLLDLVALGIVADVALQRDDARYLLQRGLDRLRLTERAGLRAMYRLAEIQPSGINEEHIGFALAPRLNALGRLSDANPAVELLTTSDPETADRIARELEGLNAQRKLLVFSVLDAARKQIERDPALLEEPVLILAHEQWPGGVIGIVASQLAERYNRPVVMLAAPPGEMVRGSARSVEGVDITACIRENAGLLHGFGGHPMAAGLSLPVENLIPFRRGLARSVGAARARAEYEGRLGGGLAVDAWLDPSQASLDLADDLNRLAPFGPGNPPLVFAWRGLRVVGCSPIGRAGERSEHLLVTVEDGAARRYMLQWWNGAAWPRPEGIIDLAYSLRARNYRAQRDLTLEWVDSRPVAESQVQLRSREFEVVDHRAAPHPRPLLDKLVAEGDSIVWAEGVSRQAFGGVDRTALLPAGTLVVWTAPPGRPELLAALEQVRPRRVVFFNLPPGDEDLEAFLRRLLGLAKYHLNHHGDQPLSLQRLAAACAQRAAAVRLGLQWHQAAGNLRISDESADAVQLLPGLGPEGEDKKIIEGKLKSLLQETAAYRKSYAAAPAENLGL